MERAEEITTKDIFNLLQGFIKQSTNSSEEIKAEIKAIKTEITKELDHLREENISLKKENEALKSRIQAGERKQKKYNLIFYGIPEKENSVEDIEDTLEIINKNLDTPCKVEDFRDLRRIGRKEENKNRPIVVEVVNYLLKTEILLKSKNLKGTSIYIARDFIPEDYQEQKLLRSKLRTAREQNQVAFIKGNRLVIDGKEYSSNEIEKEQEKTTSKGSTENKETGVSNREQTSIEHQIIKKRKLNEFFSSEASVKRRLRNQSN